jgi:hypothetical protein
VGNNLQVVDATLAHAERLAAWMRAEDVAELEASHGLAPLEALRMALRTSTIAKAALYDDEVVAIFGVTPVDALGGVGSAWCLTGEIVDELPFVFLRRSKSEARKLLEQWPVLTNAIDARYTKALRWARWLGAEVEEARPVGKAQLPFHPFSLRRS